MTLLKPETMPFGDIRDPSTDSSTFAELGNDTISQEQDLHGQQQAQQTEDDITPLQQLGQQVVENIATAQEDLIVEVTEDKTETKKGILTRLDTMIRGRELTLDRAILDLMIALSVGTLGAVGDNVALFEKIPWVGIVLEFISDHGLKWIANEFDSNVRDLVSKIAKKDYRTNKPLIGGTASLLSEGLGLGTKALVSLGFIPAGVIGDFLNPATVQSALELGKYTPIIGAFVERGVNTTDSIIGGITSIVDKVFKKAQDEKPELSFDTFREWWDKKLHEGVVFTPV